MKNLTKKEQRLIKKYPNMFNNPLFLSDKVFDYRIVNGTPVWNVLTTSGEIYWSTIKGNPQDSNSLMSFLTTTYYTAQECDNKYCLESFAVELDLRLENVEETLTEITPKVDRALLLPVATPTEIELVGVNTAREQERIKLGDGLTYDSETKRINASGGSTQHLYRHTISIGFDLPSVTNAVCLFDIYSTKSTAYDTATLKEFLDENNNYAFDLLGTNNGNPQEKLFILHNIAYIKNSATIRCMYLVGNISTTDKTLTQVSNLDESVDYSDIYVGDDMIIQIF